MFKAEKLLILLLLATALADDRSGDKRFNIIVTAHARSVSPSQLEPLIGQRHRRAALDDVTTLRLSLSSDHLNQEQPTPGSKQELSSASLQRIVNDDTSDDFVLTLAILGHMKTSLEQFVKSEPYLAAKLSLGNNRNLFGDWLLVSNHNQRPASAIIEREAAELDFIYSTFWVQFGLIIESIIIERPASPNLTDLDFRCKSPNEEKLRQLVELAAGSALYRKVLDVFATELYVHCLLRKLALIEIQSVSPSVLVRQVVEIYLDAPPTHQGAKARELSEAQVHAMASRAASFDLSQSVARHGPLEHVAGLLILDARSSLGSNGLMSGELVAHFHAECAQLIAGLSRIWSDFDELACFLSSPFADLSNLSSRIKLTAPQLLYGSICAPLAQTGNTN